VNGPAVWTVTVTVCPEPPELTWVGLNEQVAPVGNPDVHAYVTLLLNVPPAGTVSSGIDVEVV
jgi:hypothetical protein